MAQEIYLLVGVPGSGKSWVSERVGNDYSYVSHDEHIDSAYLPSIIHAATQGDKPVLIETPFSMSTIMGPLQDRGFVVTPIFVIEDEGTLEDRWSSRGTAPSARRGHLTRQNTYKARAIEHKAFVGDSSDVLFHLKMLAAERRGIKQ